MKNQPKKTSNSTPIIIIGLVLVIALVGGFLLYRASTTPPRTNTNKNSAANKTPAEVTPRVSDKQGAQPPNMLGSPTATVTVEEFADFQCPQCANKHPMVKEIISAYGPRIKFIYRNFPLSIPAHDKAYAASVAAEAAGLQNRFWDMQHQLFTNQSSWTTVSAAEFPTILAGYAQKIGLDVEKFKNDMLGFQAKQRVDLDLERGRSLGVNSTPSFFINGKPVLFEQMNTESMRQLIDAELAKAAQSSTQTAPASTPANSPSPANAGTPKK